MRSLLRLAGWGSAAAFALAIAVVAAYSGPGRQRLTFAVASLTGQAIAQKSPADAQKSLAEAANAAQLARLAETENQTRRLAELVRTINADRERLQSRVAVMERNLEDVTGSIRRQENATPPTAAPPAGSRPAPAASSGTASPPAAVPPPTASATPSPAAPPPAASATLPPSTTAPQPSRVANVVPPRESPDPEDARPALGVEIGGAANFDGLRTLWNTVNSAHGELLEGLHPLVTVRENSKTHRADLRLIAGPLPDADAVTRICNTLTAAMQPCRSVAFEGQQLSLAAPEPRQKAAPERKARERKAAPARPSGFFNP